MENESFVGNGENEATGVEVGSFPIENFRRIEGDLVLLDIVEQATWGVYAGCPNCRREVVGHKKSLDIL